MSSQFKRELCDWSASDNGSDDTRELKREKPGEGSQDLGQDYQNLLKMKDIKSLKMDYDHDRNWKKEGGAGGRGGGGGGGGGARAGVREGKQITSSSSLIDAARAAGLDISPSGSDPMSSISALLAAAQATGGLPPSCSTPDSKTKQSSASTAGPSASQGLDLSNPQTAMANVNVRPETHCLLETDYLIVAGAVADVLLHAETSDSRDGKSQGKERMSNLRENLVRQIHVEQTHAHTYW